MKSYSILAIVCALLSVNVNADCTLSDLSTSYSHVFKLSNGNCTWGMNMAQDSSCK